MTHIDYVFKTHHIIVPDFTYFLQDINVFLIAITVLKCHETIHLMGGFLSVVLGVSEALSPKPTHAGKHWTTELYSQP